MTLLLQYWPVILSFLGVLATFFYGKKVADRENQMEAQEEYIDTSERMNNVETPDSVASARRWLRDRSQ